MSRHLAAPIFKAIPSTGQMLPVVGLGTNAFREDILEQLREGMRHFASAGATMIDTAAVYGDGEQVIGRLRLSSNCATGCSLPARSPRVAARELIRSPAAGRVSTGRSRGCRRITWICSMCTIWSAWMCCCR